jgi:amphi-Trp domain-containing protein
MKKKRTVSRWSLSRRLQELALRIAAGKPIRIGGKSVRLPEEVELEEELEAKNGKTELELEIKWAAPDPGRRRPNAASRSPRKRSS